MPKKKSNSDIEKDKILKKIAIQLKSVKKKKSKKNSKESSKKISDVDSKDIESDLNDTGFFHSSQFSRNVETPAPVLERIALSSPKPIFVGKIPQNLAIMPGEEKDKDNSNYLASTEKSNEPVYEAAPEKTNAFAERIDFSTIGRELPRAISEEQRNIPFQTFEPRIESATTERVWTAEKINIEKEGRKNPFEKEEEKYKTYKPKLPKNY